MVKKIFSTITIITFLFYLHGCTKQVVMTPQEMTGEFEKDVTSINTSKCSISFKDEAVITDGFVRGQVENGTCTTKTDNILSIKSLDDKDIAVDDFTGHPKKYKDAKITFTNGEVYIVSKAFLRDPYITIELMKESHVKVDLKNVSSFTKTESNTGLTILGSVLIVGILIAIISAATYEPPKPTTQGSCPFIYSFDNEQFVMDAEPFGGSICEPLARTDYCRIDYSKPVDNKYVFRIANTRDEIQYIDEFNLYVIDHSPKYTVIPDSGGRFHLIGKAIEPEHVSINGHPEAVGYFMNDDQRYWSSDLAGKVNINDADLRDEIVMTFPKPKDAAKCNLIVKGGNTAWSSDFLMGVISLAGENRTQFTNPGILEQIKWISVEQREEIFHLKLQAWKDDNWSTIGIIPGGDISIVETQVIPLDLRDIKGDHLKIRINPPAGFWKFDWIALDYSDNQIENLKEIHAVYAKGDDGRDVSGSIKVKDKRYYVMPKTGDEAVVIFEATPLVQGLTRSVYAKVSGYYSPNFSGKTQARMDIIDRIFSEPGFIVKYSLQQYFKWNKELMAGLKNH